MLPYEWILAVFFMAMPGKPPQLVAPYQDEISCQKAAGELAKESKDALNEHNAIPVCLEIHLPKVWNDCQN